MLSGENELIQQKYRRVIGEKNSKQPYQSLNMLRTEKENTHRRSRRHRKSKVNLLSMEHIIWRQFAVSGG